MVTVSIVIFYFLSTVVVTLGLSLFFACFISTHLIGDIDFVPAIKYVWYKRSYTSLSAEVIPAVHFSCCSPD